MHVLISVRVFFLFVFFFLSFLLFLSEVFQTNAFYVHVLISVRVFFFFSFLLSFLCVSCLLLFTVIYCANLRVTSNQISWTTQLKSNFW